VNDRTYVLVCHDAGGTVPPMLALASALIGEGAAVTVLSQPSVQARAVGAGCSFVAFSELDSYDRTRALEQQLERSLPAMVGASVGTDLLRVAHDLRPAAVVVDANLTGALAAAESLGVLSVVLLHSMYKTFVDVWFGELWAALDVPINETRERFGVPAVSGWREMFARHTAAMSVVTSSFDAPVSEPLDNLQHFGFLVPDRPTARPDLPVGDKPLALVSLSTTFQAQGDLLDAIVQGATSHARLFVTTGGYGAVNAADPGVVVSSYVPHCGILRDVDLVITHAGLGTVAAALAYGAPLVCTPMGRDQRLNTERVEATGAGVGISPLSSPDDIAAAVEQVLRDHNFADAARRQAELSDQEGGPTAAAVYLMGLGS
jgi:UDP:flavonoid glycosyltransferase YjiC (YdhE family)